MSRPTGYCRAVWQVLYVSGNNMVGTLPEQLGKLSHLRFLNASENNISGTVRVHGVVPQYVLPSHSRA